MVAVHDDLYHSTFAARRKGLPGAAMELGMATIRFALVGSAREASPWLLRSLAKVGTFEAICDPAAEREAGQHDARWVFSELAALLREAEPQGVVIQRPVAERPRLIKECLAAGASALVLGPPGPAASCKRIETLVKLANRVVFAAPPIRFSPTMLLARKLVESGKLGAPISMTLHSVRPAPSGGPDGDSGAVPIDQVYEAVDLVSQLIGPIRRIQAIDHPEGVLAALAETTAAVPVSMVFHAARTTEAAGLELEIRSAEGTVLRIGRNLELFCGTDSRVEAARSVTIAACDPALELGYEGLVAQFARSMEGGQGGWGSAGAVPEVTMAAEGVLGAAARRRPISLKPAQTPAGAGSSD